MKRLLSVVLLLCASVRLYGQGATVLFPALEGPNGQDIPFAKITFCTTPATFDSLGNCTNTVAVFQQIALLTQYSSAILTDGLGNFPPNQITTTALWFAPAANLCYSATGSSILNTVNTCKPFSVSVATGSSPTFAALTVTGAVTAQSVGGVQYAATYAGSSTTCGITEAINALPSKRGKVILQNGNCSASGWPVTISTAVVIEGQGMGGPTDAGTNATLLAGSYLTNTSTGSSFFIVTLPGGGNSIEGITLRDFAMIGNKAIGGATAGDCVDINGGITASQVRMINFQNLQCNQPKGSGWVVQDNVFQINFDNVQVQQSGSHCLVLKDGTNSGTISQFNIIKSVFDLCGGSNVSVNPGTADAINISGSTPRGIEFIESTAADSLNGINVVAGATNASVHVTNSDFESNTTADINLNDGYDHVIFASRLLGNSTGARGVLTAMPVGANFTQTQLIMLGNSLSGHTTQDITIGANQHLCYIGPQAQNNFSFSDASATCVRTDVNSAGALLFTGLGGFLPAADGTSAIGGSSNAWLNLFNWRQFVHEFTALSCIGGFDCLYGDSTLHGLVKNDNNTVFTPVGSRAILTADWTCGTTGTVASCVAPTIIGSGGGVPWTFNLPLVANSLQLDCDGIVAQATGNTASGWNLLTATNGATNVQASYFFPVNGATAPTLASNTYSTAVASTTTTFQIGGNWTLGALVGAAKYPFHIHAAIEGASASGTVLSVQLATPTVGDLMTIFRGSGCWIHP